MVTEYPAVVFLPCPGRPVCPEQLFGVEFHQHFMRAGHRVRVRRLLPGCWETLCPCCPEQPVVAQVATWERAMQRASEHVREAHSEPESAPPSDRQVAAACRALYSRWTWDWMRLSDQPDPVRLHHELYCALLGEEAAVRDFDGSVYTDDDGIVHVKVLRGEQAYEIRGAPRVTAGIQDVTVQLVPVAEPETEQQLHARCACPGWEYATTEGPRKQWDGSNEPPCDEQGVPDPSWERNADAGRDGWERFDYTEESYWRRRVDSVKGGAGD